MTDLSEKRINLEKKIRLIWQLARNDFFSKYASSQLGIFWAFFKPVVMACVYIVVFSVIARATPVSGIYPYALWMLPGLIVWYVFSDAVSSGVSTLTEYSYLVKNIKFDISILPCVKVVSAFIIHTFFVLLVFVLYLVMRLPVKIYMLQMIYYYLATFIFTLSITRIVCAIQPFFKDLSAAIEIILLVGIWACPIMWDLHMIPESYAFYFKLNPLYHLVDGYRNCFMGDNWFWEKPKIMATFWCVTLFLEFFGRKVFKRLSAHFSDVI